ncbi:sodium transport system ATP-binding protein [Stigmatella aurantiaca]|uniref:Sodium transport system ATP-binding protein n=1 Tax=Stigmatella aurantiaca TaxID=41 RepID=A0A1H7X9G7_STIAU|nr:ATP-binding cassette domain-containing protein [Stigmatella aurantiaca]SEM30460.1 sodium transport system ATP-binding protein [Stigmatella aurantiaca]
MIEAKDLSKSYPTTTAVQGVSLHVGPGEVVGVVGPHGAGKTTLLRMLAGLLAPSAGEAIVAGVSTAAQPFRIKSRVGFVSGDQPLPPHPTPRELLIQQGQLQGLSKDVMERRLEDLINTFEMERFAALPCATLTAEQRQRTNLACAFMKDPAVLILDEPTHSLDMLSSRFLHITIRAAREAGLSVLLSSSALGDAESLCDRVVLLHRGRVLDQGTIPEVCGHVGVRSLSDAFLWHLPQLSA